MSEELKPLPCPFCGEEATWFSIDQGNHFGSWIECLTCDATSPEFYTTNMEGGKKNALDSWNKRTREKRLKKLLKQARDKIELWNPFDGLIVAIDAELSPASGSEKE